MKVPCLAIVFAFTMLSLSCDDVLPTEADNADGVSTTSAVLNESASQAKHSLYGSVAVEYNLGWPGPQADIPDWAGSITIDEIEYGMLFYNIGSGKPFLDPFKGSVVFFDEIWAVHTWVDFNFETQELQTGDMLMWGYDRGVVTAHNSKYRMTGTVEEAFGDFSEWEGRPMHMSGTIEWYPFGAPHYGWGPFRVN